jgi:hypothetical protein
MSETEDAMPQLSVGVGSVHVTAAAAIETREILAGQVMLGTSLSVTTTSKEQVVVLPEASVTLKVFVVVPIGKTEPDAKPAVCVVVDVQLSAPTGVV